MFVLQDDTLLEISLAVLKPSRIKVTFGTSRTVLEVEEIKEEPTSPQERKEYDDQRCELARLDHKDTQNIMSVDVQKEGTRVTCHDLLFAVEKPYDVDEPIILSVYEMGRCCAIELSPSMRDGLIRELRQS